jgi:hypothetical protein
MPQLAAFCRQVRSRSNEHNRAMQLMACAGIVGQMVAILRQELDSMVRVIYLLDQSHERRDMLIEQSVKGERWNKEKSRGHVTDRDMVDLAEKLHGWTRSVYKFGCAFIHLSDLHDYNDRDPIKALCENDRQGILDHCRHYHQGPATNDPELADFVPLLPDILAKISSNLECYLKDLEEGRVAVEADDRP